MEIIKQIIDVFIHLDDYLGPVIQEWGPWIYGLLFLIIFCETGLVVTPFLPGDSLLFAAGAFAATGQLSLSLLLISLTIAAVLGDSVNYAIGQFLGPRLIAMKRFRLIKQEHLDKTHDFFERYGGKTIILARFVPIVRTFAPFVAGLGSMTYRQFMSYNVLGGILWVALCTCAGYLLGSWPPVKKHFEIVLIGIVFVSVLPMAVEILLARRKQQTSKDPSRPPESAVRSEHDA